eukprot:Rmarinus@m.7171
MTTYKENRPPTGAKQMKLLRPGTGTSRRVISGDQFQNTRPGTGASRPMTSSTVHSQCEPTAMVEEPRPPSRPHTGSLRPGTGASCRPGTGASQRPGTGQSLSQLSDREIRRREKLLSILERENNKTALSKQRTASLNGSRHGSRSSRHDAGNQTERELHGSEALLQMRPATQGGNHAPLPPSGRTCQSDAYDEDWSKIDEYQKYMHLEEKRLKHLRTRQEQEKLSSALEQQLEERRKRTECDRIEKELYRIQEAKELEKFENEKTKERVKERQRKSEIKRMLADQVEDAYRRSNVERQREAEIDKAIVEQARRELRKQYETEQKRRRETYELRRKMHEDTMAMLQNEKLKKEKQKEEEKRAMREYQEHVAIQAELRRQQELEHKKRTNKREAQDKTILEKQKREYELFEKKVQEEVEERNRQLDSEEKRRIEAARKRDKEMVEILNLQLALKKERKRREQEEKHILGQAFRLEEEQLMKDKHDQLQRVHDGRLAYRKQLEDQIRRRPKNKYETGMTAVEKRMNTNLLQKVDSFYTTTVKNSARSMSEYEPPTLN